jgi:hypothetical protein
MSFLSTFEGTFRLAEVGSLMKFSLGIAVVVSLSLAACAKQPTTQVTVRVAEGYFGHIRVTPCIPDAPATVALDDTQSGSTSACPRGDVEVVVIKPTRKFVLAPENVHVRRGGDRSPGTITAEIP